MKPSHDKDVFNWKNSNKNILLQIYQIGTIIYIFFIILINYPQRPKIKKKNGNLKTPLTRFKVFFLSLFLQSNNWWGTNFPKFIKIFRILNKHVYLQVHTSCIQLFLLTNISIQFTQ